jgi:hypothetical protein
MIQLLSEASRFLSESPYGIRLSYAFYSIILAAKRKETGCSGLILK